MDDYLMHYGRKGMKWYQNVFSKGKESSAKKKSERVSRDVVRKREERSKDDIRSTNKASIIAKNLDKFTDDELSSIVRRLENQNKIRDIALKDKKRGDSIAKAILSYGVTLAKYYDLLATTNGGKALVTKISKGKFLPTFPGARELNLDKIVENESGKKKKKKS